MYHTFPTAVIQVFPLPPTFLILPLFLQSLKICPPRALLTRICQFIVLPFSLLRLSKASSSRRTASILSVGVCRKKRKSRKCTETSLPRDFGREGLLWLQMTTRTAGLMIGTKRFILLLVAVLLRSVTTSLQKTVLLFLPLPLVEVHEFHRVRASTLPRML